MNITIRPYGPGDSEATWAVFHQAVQRTRAAYYTLAQLAAWDPGRGEPADCGARRASAWTLVATVETSWSASPT